MVTQAVSQNNNQHHIDPDVALADLRAFRAKKDLSFETDRAAQYEAILADNARLLNSEKANHLSKLEADQQAILEGQRALELARQKAGVLRRQNSAPAAPAPLSMPDVTPAFRSRLFIFSEIARESIKRSMWKKGSGPDGTPEHPDLDQAVRLWSVIRYRATQLGRAEFSTNDLIAFTSELLSWDRGKVLHALKAGSGIFWEPFETRATRRDKRQKAYKLCRPERVCEALGLDNPGQRVMLPDAAFSGNLDHFRAHAYSAYFHLHPTVYRARLEDLFNATRPTLLKWEKIADIHVQPNDVTMNHPTNEAELAEWQNRFTQRNGRVKRHWIVATKTEKAGSYSATVPICSAGLFDSENEPLPNSGERTAYVMRQVVRPGCQVHYQTQDANTFTPTATRLLPSGRARYVRRALQKDPSISQNQRATVGGSCKRATYPRRFETESDGVVYRSRRPHRTAQIHQKRLRRTRRSRIRESNVYHEYFSLWAVTEFPRLDPVRQQREMVIRYA